MVGGAQGTHTHGANLHMGLLAVVIEGGVRRACCAHS